MQIRPNYLSRRLGSEREIRALLPFKPSLCVGVRVAVDLKLRNCFTKICGYTSLQALKL
jgi:hypothetical protein